MSHFFFLRRIQLTCLNRGTGNKLQQPSIHTNRNHTMKNASTHSTNAGNALKSFIAIICCAFVASVAQTATAAEKFDDKATVEIEGMPGGGSPIYVLEKTGEDNNGDGIYRLFAKSGSRYLTVTNADAGTMVGWTSKDGEMGSEWILHKNSSGWSIIAKANGANAVSRNDNASSKIDLQRNQGAAHQVWNITKK
jgi:hypothetical protein